MELYGKTAPGLSIYGRKLLRDLPMCGFFEKAANIKGGASNAPFGPEYFEI